MIWKDIAEKLVITERRIADKKQLLDDVANEYELLQHQAFDMYKGYTEYMRFYPKSIEKVQDWVIMLRTNKDKAGNKLNKRKKYVEKSSYEFFITTLAEYLEIDKVEITEIMQYNWGQAWDIEFICLESTWKLRVPVVTSIHFEDYQRYGKEVFGLQLCYQDGPSSWIRTGVVFNENDLKDLMTESIEKYCKENKDD